MKIIELQELPENLELLAAQKNIYSRAKNIIGVQILLCIPVAIVAVVIAIMKPELKGYAALWGILVVIFDLFIFTPWIRTLRDNAARIQELFDTKVLGLDWNEIAVGKKPDPEVIHEEANIHGLDEKNLSVLRKWYPIIIDNVPEIYGIVICQRSNVWWDARMRRAYAFYLRVFLVSIAITLIGYGLYEKKDMFDFLAYLVAPLSSTYIFGYRQMVDQSAAADRLDKLKEISEKIWRDALSGEEPSTLKPKCRALQDQIFKHRKENPPIFDFLFKWFRDGNELLMNKGAETLVSEVYGVKKEMPKKG
ncbi:S-4TM family putative pore-forming effector [Teredinibacter turnerae]|uniref:S-4TM family putative pore-forming effector n=1 Tax=Teredinibacter turnerae TaxID=2426 RepID=UPI0030D4C72C